MSEPVTLEDIYQIFRTSAEEFDRRLRELRDECGVAIETGSWKGEAAYRLLSNQLQNAHPRGYLSATEKENLFQKHQSTCAICGQDFSQDLSC